MCYKKPGPRCSSHARQQVKLSKQKFEDNPTAQNKERYHADFKEFLITPDGFEYLAKKGETKMLEQAKALRQKRINDYVKSGGRKLPQMVVMRGISGSGKSTWARKWVAEDPENRVRVNRDEIREELFAGRIDYSQEQEGNVDVVERNRIKSALDGGKDVVVDATHVSDKKLNRMAQFACSSGGEAKVKSMSITPDQAQNRVAERAKSGGLYVPDSIIREQYAALVKSEKQRLDV